MYNVTNALDIKGHLQVNTCSKMRIYFEVKLLFEQN